MSKRLTDSRLASLVANAIHSAFDGYQIEFMEITKRARIRFENRDWRGMQADAAERLDLYKRVVDRNVTEVHKLLGDRLHDKLVWVSLKAVYSSLIGERDDWELAETFFNSITRRIFTTVGVDPQIEFVDTDFDTPPTQARHTIYRAFERQGSTSELVEKILKDYEFESPYQDMERDAKQAAIVIKTYLRSVGALREADRIEMVRSVFYRNNRAYLIGRIFSGAYLGPIALALVHQHDGIAVDAVMLNEDDVSIIFSFTRSYFIVQTDRPHDLVEFLKTILPRKRRAELYISIGQHKHGKTELYRGLLQHMATSDDPFEIAPGERGMVMNVFTLPSYDLIFKVIKDKFAGPKQMTRAAVMGKYHLVFKHDRAGRLVDAQEFEYLKFDKHRFSPGLLQELLTDARQTVRVDGDCVIIRHAYLERRVIPLNIFIKEAEEPAVRSAVVDYGRAIKDLAVSNIFPGDVLLKNFGVTRHGRVVFYDYDELCLLTDCTFRTMPEAENESEELADEPWFYVAEKDVFPIEFRTFLGLPSPLRETFAEHHSDLFDIGFWTRTQDRLRAGEVIDTAPYDDSKRLFPQN